MKKVLIQNQYLCKYPTPGNIKYTILHNDKRNKFRLVVTNGFKEIVEVFLTIQPPVSNKSQKRVAALSGRCFLSVILYKMMENESTVIFKFYNDKMIGELFSPLCFLVLPDVPAKIDYKYYKDLANKDLLTIDFDDDTLLTFYCLMLRVYYR